MAFSFDEIVSKVVEGAEIAADIAGQAARNVQASVKKTIEISTLNTKIKGLSFSISGEFMQIGELVYKTYKDPEISVDSLDKKMEYIDALYTELEEVKAERDRRINER